MNRKWIIAGVLSTTLFISSLTATAEFQDVTAPYEEAVQYMVDRDLTKGYSSKEYGIHQLLTRGDAAVILAKAAYYDQSSVPKAPFTDVNSRIERAVSTLYANGIISGKSTNSFAPEDYLTRAEIAKILTNIYDIEPQGYGTPQFKDVNSYWWPYVSILLANSITKGKTSSTFEPYAPLTRGEFALFIYRSKNIHPFEPMPGPDYVAPVMNYNGPIEFELQYGTNTFKVPVVTATDDVNGDVVVFTQIFFEENTTAIKNINTFNPGMYTIKYRALDRAGNLGSLDIKVRVLPEK